MLLYNILFYSLIIVSIIGLDSQLKYKSFFYGIFAILLILFAGLRNEIGYDWYSYLDIFLQSKSDLFESSYIEYGFQALAYISPSFRFLIFATAAISLSLTLSAFYKFSNRQLPFLGLVIFATTLYFPTYMGQIRQGISMGIVLWGFVSFCHNEKLKTVILFIIAIFFHYSAIVAFFIFIIGNNRFPLWIYFTVLTFALFLSTSVMGIFASIMGHFNSIISIKMIAYATQENYELGITSTIFIRFMTFFMAYKLNSNNNKTYSFLINAYFIGIIQYLILGFAPQFAVRGSMYFTILEAVLIPFIVYKLHKIPVLYFSSFTIFIMFSIYRFIRFFDEPLNIECFLNK